MDVDDIACQIGDEVRGIVHSMIENYIADLDLDEDEAAELSDAIWCEWKDWV